jgi:acyl-CoA synthetase (NDP forming)
MTHDLSRLFQPKSIAVIGGGAWCRAVTEQLQKAGYEGQIWPIHPRSDDICGLKTYPTVLDAPAVPDAVFIGINRDATIGAVERLARIGAGGAVCFASGFGETEDGKTANARLLAAAGDMPILGPNCYGMINALDGVSLWPDQHGCIRVDKGVAILTQSSNIAINLTMQQRGLPIAYVVTCGNQAQLSEARIAAALLDDPRVTAIGLHVEGFGDLAGWQTLSRKARTKGIPLVALKVGRSKEARAATVSHTASLAGSDTGAQALLDHLGIARVNDLSGLIETLKILHVNGPLASGRIASISCSGGEASLIADLAHATPLSFPPLTETQRDALFTALGPKVDLANPLDYHTYIWRDKKAMTAAFSAMIEPHLAITLLIVDFPRSDRCDPSDWECVIDAALQTKADTGAPLAMVATLPELMPESVAARLMAGGVIPLNGLADALTAIIAAQPFAPSEADLIAPTATATSRLLSETEAKEAFATFGLPVPASRSGPLAALADASQNLTGPFVLKSTNLAHKSDSGGVALGLQNADAIRAAGRTMPGDTFLLEEMVTGGVAELLVGITKDPAHGFVLTLAAGGILTEVLQDTVSLLVPASRTDIKQALTHLRMSKILSGYRGAPPAATGPTLDAIEAIQAYVVANAATVEEVEVNPLICTQTRAVAVDALIRKADD